MRSTPSEGKRRRATARKASRAGRKMATSAVNVAVTFRHVDPSDALRQYAERKFTHVVKYLRRAAQIHLILAVDKYRQCGEVTLTTDGLTVTAHQETKDLYAVIDLLTDKLGRQLKSHFGKTTGRKLRAQSTGAAMAEADER